MENHCQENEVDYAGVDALCEQRGLFGDSMFSLARQANFSDPQYWSERYRAVQTGQSAMEYDWYDVELDSFASEILAPVLLSVPSSSSITEPNQFASSSSHGTSSTQFHSSILVVGCGNSTWGPQLTQRWSRLRLINTDIDATVIQHMAALYPSSQWEVADLCALQYQDASFDCVLDKACLDALVVPGQQQNVDHVVASIVQQVHRVLCPSGVWLVISNQPPEIMQQYVPSTRFSLIVEDCDRLKRQRGRNAPFVYVFRKVQ